MAFLQVKRHEPRVSDVRIVTLKMARCWLSAIRGFRARRHLGNLGLDLKIRFWSSHCIALKGSVKESPSWYMNDIYGITFFKTFFIEGHQLSLLLVVPLQGAPLARAKRVTHGYVGLAFSHKPSHIFLIKSMKLNTDCAFRACFCLMLKHVGIMLEWCLTHFVWQHFGRLFTPIFR